MALTPWCFDSVMTLNSLTHKENRLTKGIRFFSNVKTFKTSKTFLGKPLISGTGLYSLFTHSHMGTSCCPHNWPLSERWAQGRCVNSILGNAMTLVEKHQTPHPWSKNRKIASVIILDYMSVRACHVDNMVHMWIVILSVSDFYYRHSCSVY